MLQCDVPYIFILHCNVQKCARPPYGTCSSQTLLAWASRRGHVETIELLIGKGAAVMAGDGRMRTPLHRACSGCFSDVAKVGTVQVCGVISFRFVRCSCGGFVEVGVWVLQQFFFFSLPLSPSVCSRPVPVAVYCLCLSAISASPSVYIF